MRPTDKKTGKYWSPDNANAKLQDIKTEIVAELRARDASRGIPPDGKMYREYESDPENPGRGKLSMEPIPELVNVQRSCGRDVNLMLRSRWAEFISEPRAEASYAKSTLTTVRAAALSKAQAAASEVEKSVTPRAMGSGMMPVAAKIVTPPPDSDVPKGPLTAVNIGTAEEQDNGQLCDHDRTG